MKKRIFQEVVIKKPTNIPKIACTVSFILMFISAVNMIIHSFDKDSVKSFCRQIILFGCNLMLYCLSERKKAEFAIKIKESECG